VSVVRAGGHGHSGHSEYRYPYISVLGLTTDKDMEALLHMCCDTWKWVTVISVRVVLDMAIVVDAVCCVVGGWEGTCVSMVRTASIFRVLGCVYDEEDCKSRKRHRPTARFVQQTTAQYLP
jgi:hypothetical protein